MKYLSMLALLALPFSGAFAQANAIDTYFQRYVDDESFTVVYISPKLFQLLDRMGADELDLDDKESEIFMSVATDLRGLRILSTDENPLEYYRSALSVIDKDLYEPLMTVRGDDGGNLEFMIRENSEGIIEELLLVAGGDDSFTLMSFVGQIDLEKVMELGQEMQDKNDE